MSGCAGRIPVETGPAPSLQISLNCSRGRTVSEQGERRDGSDSRRKIKRERRAIDLPKRSGDDAREQRGYAGEKKVNSQSATTDIAVHAFDDQCLEHGIGQRIEESVEGHGQ